MALKLFGAAKESVRKIARFLINTKKVKVKTFKFSKGQRNFAIGATVAVATKSTRDKRRRRKIRESRR